MENGHGGLQTPWNNGLITARFNAYRISTKLRIGKNPKDLLKSTTGVDDLSLIITPETNLPEDCMEILDWVRQEVLESIRMLYMSTGFVLPDLNVEFKGINDVFTYSTGNSLMAAEIRLIYALETMKILAKCEKFRPKALLLWPDALNFAKTLPTSAELAREICLLIGLDTVDKVDLNIKKFRENDDVYVLQHGFTGYNDALNRILQKIGGREWDIQVLEVLERRASMIADFQQIKCLVDVLPSVLSMVDMRIQQSLNRIFKTSFSTLIFSIKKQVLNYYYQKYQCWNTAELDTTYGTELTTIINSLAQGASKGSYRNAAIKLSWLFMLSAKQCWWKILTEIVKTPALVQPVIEILRFLPPVVSLRLKESNENRLILEGCSRLVEQNTLQSEDQESAWTNFVVHLCNGSPKKAVIDATEIVQCFLLPMLPKYPALILECLQKIFDDKTAIIAWREEFFSDKDNQKSNNSNEEFVDATRLFQSVFSIFTRASRRDHSDNASNLEVRKLSPIALSSMVNRWKFDKVSLPVNAFDWLKSVFDALPWVQQLYAFWLLRDCCDKVGVIETPSCLCDMLSLPPRKFIHIECPISGDHSKINCALSSMIEAACFSSEMSIIFLQDGDVGKLYELSASLKLRNHLLFAVKNNLECRNLVEWKNVIVWLDRLFEKIGEKHQCDLVVEVPEFVAGQKFVAPVTLLADVAVTLLAEDPHTDIVKSWLQNFYSIARDSQTMVLDKLSNNLTKETALRHIWYACVIVVKKFKNTPKQLEWLLISLNEAYRRAGVNFNHDMVNDIMPHVSAEVGENLLKKSEARIPEEVQLSS